MYMHIWISAFMHAYVGKCVCVCAYVCIHGLVWFGVVWYVMLGYVMVC